MEVKIVDSDFILKAGFDESPSASSEETVNVEVVAFSSGRDLFIVSFFILIQGLIHTNGV